MLSTGDYATTVNIYNPSDTTAVIFKFLSLSFPPEVQLPGITIPISQDKLPSGCALKVDCNDIMNRFYPNGFPSSYIEGFVILKSTESLDVSTVYTSTSSKDRQYKEKVVPSIDVEQINERKIGRNNVRIPCRPIRQSRPIGQIRE